MRRAAQKQRRRRSRLRERWLISARPEPGEERYGFVVDPVQRYATTLIDETHSRDQYRALLKRVNPSPGQMVR